MYTASDLNNLKAALASGERRVSIGDKTVEYRSIDELKRAIAIVEAELAQQAGGRRRVRQIRVNSSKGF